jgi:hypothetical protein
MLGGGGGVSIVGCERTLRAWISRDQESDVMVLFCEDTCFYSPGLAVEVS